jgi:hypothetical protein
LEPTQPTIYSYQTDDGNLLIHPTPHGDGVYGVNVVGRLYATDTDESGNARQEVPEGRMDLVNAIKSVERRTTVLETNLQTLVDLVGTLAVSHAAAALKMEEMTEQLKISTAANTKSLGELVSQLANNRSSSTSSDDIDGGDGGGSDTGANTDSGSSSSGGGGGTIARSAVPSLWGGAPPWTGANNPITIEITRLKTDADEAMWKSFFGTQRYFYGSITFAGLAVEAERAGRVMGNLEQLAGKDGGVLRLSSISGRTFTCGKNLIGLSELVITGNSGSELTTFECAALKDVMSVFIGGSGYSGSTSDIKLATVLLPGLESVSGGFSVRGGALVNLAVPKLATVGGTVTVSDTALVELAMPSLVTAGGLTLNSNAQLAKLTLPGLELVSSQLLISVSGGALVNLTVPKLVMVGSYINIRGTALVELAMPSLVTADGLTLISNAQLAKLTLPSLKTGGSLSVRSNPRLGQDAICPLIAVGQRVNVCSGGVVIEGPFFGPPAETNQGDCGNPDSLLYGTMCP